MLVLSRRVEESIVIQGSDGNVTVMLLGIENDRAKIGIVAPDNVVVLREELLQPPAGTAQKLRRIPSTPEPSRRLATGNLALKP